jgi:hypothetical protein
MQAAQEEAASLNIRESELKLSLQQTQVCLLLVFALGMQI